MLFCSLMTVYANNRPVVVVTVECSFKCQKEPRWSPNVFTIWDFSVFTIHSSQFGSRSKKVLHWICCFTFKILNMAYPPVLVLNKENKSSSSCVGDVSGVNISFHLWLREWRALIKANNNDKSSNNNVTLTNLTFKALVFKLFRRPTYICRATTEPTSANTLQKCVCVCVHQLSIKWSALLTGLTLSSHCGTTSSNLVSRACAHECSEHHHPQVITERVDTCNWPTNTHFTAQTTLWQITQKLLLPVCC